ncbi:hypothetical protein D4758_16815 [Enterocloster citroniae]|jgi:hypothetical protein|nr:hypothetical protein [Enterocloster citroniae]
MIVAFLLGIVNKKKIGICGMGRRQRWTNEKNGDGAADTAAGLAGLRLRETARPPELCKRLSGVI